MPTPFNQTDWNRFKVRIFQRIKVEGVVELPYGRNKGLAPNPDSTLPPYNVTHYKSLE